MALTEGYAGDGARPRLLVLRALGLGDLLVGVPAYRALRRAFHRHRVVLAAPAALAPLALLTGAVDEVLPFATPEAGRWRTLPWPGGPPDVAVNLHGRGPQSHAALVALRPRRLWAFAHSSFPEVGGPAWIEDGHEVARWCALLEHYGIRADPGDLALRAPPRPSPCPGAVVVHPGAAYPARRWPAERFAEVAAALHRAGHPVVITGRAAERSLAVAVTDAAGLSYDARLAGRTDVLDLAALVASARLVISGDTGVAHLATAYGTASVVLFGPTLPSEWGPPPRPRHVVLRHGDTPSDPRDTAPAPALLAIRVDEVLAAANRLLEPASEKPTAPAALEPATAEPVAAPDTAEPPAPEQAVVAVPAPRVGINAAVGGAVGSTSTAPAAG